MGGHHWRSSLTKPKTMKQGQAAEFLLDAVLASLVKQDLGMDEDDPRALRRALLALIWLTQEKLTDTPSSKLVSDFIEYLLIEFVPLADYFREHRHFLARGESVMRGRLADGSTGLLIKTEFGQRLLVEGMDFLNNDADG